VVKIFPRISTTPCINGSRDDLRMLHTKQFSLESPVGIDLWYGRHRHQRRVPLVFVNVAADHPHVFRVVAVVFAPVPVGAVLDGRFVSGTNHLIQPNGTRT
jgi:hypothetical protein